MDGLLSNRRHNPNRRPYLNSHTAVWLGLMALCGVFWFGVFWLFS